MTGDDFLSRLKKFYTAPHHVLWQNNISTATSKVSHYLEDNFWNNHFKHFEYSEDGRIDYEVLYKYHAGMWHLHVANLFYSLGYELVKPAGRDDIHARIGKTDLFIECVSPSLGNKNNPIRITHQQMFMNFVRIDNLDKNMVYKLQSTVNSKVKTIKKRRKIKKGIYILAMNEGPLVNGFRKWNTDVNDRYNQIVNNPSTSSTLDCLFYGSVLESEYCQPDKGVVLVKNFLQE